jgi:hypothetical protein
MTVHAERGTKRTWNERHGVRFYDFQRNAITCPICHTPCVPPTMRELEGTLSTNHSAFHRPSASNVQAAQMAPKQSELQIGADEGGDAEAKKDDNSSGVLPRPEDQKE